MIRVYEINRNRINATKAKNFARNERIFEAVILGSGWAAAAAAEGLAEERARQVVHKMCRMMLYPPSLGADILPHGYSLSVQDLRKHSAFWLSQLVKWRAEHGTGSLVSA